MKLLVIEDEPKVATFIKSGLEEHKYEVDIVYDGLLGKKMALAGNYQLIILDVIIPYMNGLELCKEIRAVKPNIPILMLTALGTTEDKVTGFEAGADDYLVKPFEFVELIARIRALTKRNGSIHEFANKLKVADLELDLDKKIAIRENTSIELTAKEFALLEYFMRNSGRVLSRMDISEHVWDISFDTETNVVDVYINILRKKIDKNYTDKLIHTRIGMGYIFGKDL